MHIFDTRGKFPQLQISVTGVRLPGAIHAFCIYFDSNHCIKALTNKSVDDYTKGRVCLIPLSSCEWL